MLSSKTEPTVSYVNQVCVEHGVTPHHMKSSHVYLQLSLKFVWQLSAQWLTLIYLHVGVEHRAHSTDWDRESGSSAVVQ